MEKIRKERVKLEAFLFNESNKVTKSTIKFVLEKWLLIESELQEELMKNEKLKLTIQNNNVPSLTRSYAQVTGTPLQSQTSKITVEKARQIKEKRDHEVLLIKPKSDEDKRSNDEIRTAVTSALSSVCSKIKIKSIRQMRKKGLVIEMKGKNDMEIIKNAKLECKDLKIESPKKILPSIIIYDVEKEYKLEELKEDFITKNFEKYNHKELDGLRETIVFRHHFKTKEDRVNWIVQVPGRLLVDLINQGRIYMLWRTYRVKEYINVTRCFKCQSFGHIAKVCNFPDQICEICGSKDHLKNDCKKKDSPQCSNCTRAKRKDVNHTAGSKVCPEYVKNVEIYRSKLEWG